MATSEYHYLTAKVERNVLVLTITATHLQGERVAAALLEELLKAASEFAAQKIVIDMQQIQYMSSVAFRPLLVLRGRLQRSGGRMILCGLTPYIGDIFYTTKMLSPSGSLDAPFQMEVDAAAAIERLNRAEADK
jgi:anti-sigma B factor antagonist